MKKRDYDKVLCHNEGDEIRAAEVQAREEAGELVAKHARWHNSSSPDHRYFIRYNGKSYFASSPELLADKLAAVILNPISE